MEKKHERFVAAVMLQSAAEDGGGGDVLQDDGLHNHRRALLASSSQTYTFRGCFKDTHDRDLPHNHINNPRFMSPDVCNEKCQGYKHFSMQAGSHCFCGDSYGKHGELNARTSCATRCPGGEKGSLYKCGGIWANSVYDVKALPTYVFEHQVGTSLYELN